MNLEMNCLRMKKTASRYGRQLRKFWLSGWDNRQGVVLQLGGWAMG